MKNGRKPIFFTSDWHINHAAVIGFSNRPFKNVDHMSEQLIKRFNVIVPEDGVTYFLGDMGFCGQGALRSVIDQLNGTKILVRGNHDKGMNAMYNAGFDVVIDSGSIHVLGELVTFSHCPLRGVFREDTTGMRGATEGENWHKETAHTQFSIEDQGQFHLHGHLHAPNNGKSEVKLDRQWDIGIDGNGYRPVSLSEIERWIVKTKREENG